MGVAYVNDLIEVYKILDATGDHEDCFAMWQRLPGRIKEEGIMSASGIYAFINKGLVWDHFYLGLADERLGPRVNEQLHLRQWASEVFLFPLSHLSFSALESLEKRLLRVCNDRFRWAYTDNEKDLSGPAPDPFAKRGIYSDIDELTRNIIRCISQSLYKSRDQRKKPKANCTLGAPDGALYGVGCQKGRWLYLLPGSRISSRYPNFKTIKQDPGALERYERFYRRGQIAKRPGTLVRPEGFVVTEPIPFRNKRSAARFLNGGENVIENWEPIKPKWKA